MTGKRGQTGSKGLRVGLGTAVLSTDMWASSQRTQLNRHPIVETSEHIKEKLILQIK